MEMLTDKAKQDFEKWYAKRYWQQHDSPTLEWFFGEYMPFSMQWGVYVDFFDSVGVDVDVTKLAKGFYMSQIEITKDCFYETEENEHPTRNEARKKAIEKANEIYNQDQRLSILTNNK